MVGDFSSKYEDKMVPMLDLKNKMVTMREEKDIENGIPAYEYRYTSLFHLLQKEHGQG